MINRLLIQGFKCFNDEDFVLAPLTLLSGLNSSGKSTFIQAIRLIYGSNHLPRLGPLPELVSKLHSNFKILMNNTVGEEYVFEYPESKNYDYPYVNPSLLAYISAARLGPELHLPISGEHKGVDVGERGEYVLEFLEHHIELAGLPDILRRSEAKSSAVRHNVSAWLSIISPGIQFEWESIPKADIIRAEYSGYRPSNVGFGVPYTLPIIANVLGYAAIVAKGEEHSAVLLIENPEAHLHPAGQTQLGEFLARAAACGVQIVIETHSDHLLNGIRLAVKKKMLSSQQTVFYYFYYDFENEFTSVKQPMIDEEGFFDEWPDGFFDETEKNLERIL